MSTESNDHDAAARTRGEWRIGAAIAIGVGIVFAAQWFAFQLRETHPLLTGLLVFSPLLMLAILDRAIEAAQRDSGDSAAERTATRRARRRIAIGTIWYCAIIYVSQWVLWLLDGAHPALRGLIAFTPMLGLGVILRGMMQAHRESDELHRRIDAEAAVIAACVVGLVTFATGLVAAELKGKMPMMPTLHVGPLLIAVWGIAKWRLTKRYIA